MASQVIAFGCGNFIDYMATSRNWNDNEEDVLLTILEEMVVDGVRCETGSFKAGTFVTVATKMKEMIPGITIEPKHIQNKLKRLKEKYSSAYDMMNTTGFGWNDEKKCVVVDSDDVLQLWVKVHFISYSCSISCFQSHNFDFFGFLL